MAPKPASNTPAPSPTPPPSRFPLGILLGTIGGVFSLVVLTLLGLLFYKHRRRQLRRLKKQKLTGTGAIPSKSASLAPGGFVTDEEKQRLSMGLKVPVRAHLDPGPPKVVLAGQGGRGQVKRGTEKASAGAGGGGGFKWEEDEAQGMRKMMRKLSVS